MSNQWTFIKWYGGEVGSSHRKKKNEIKLKACAFKGNFTYAAQDDSQQEYAWISQRTAFRISHATW